MEIKIIEQIGIVYEINGKNLTAEIIKSQDAKGNILLPSIIMHESKEYKVISIKEYSFKSNNNIISLSITDDSYLQSIGRKAFSLSLISKLFIPKDVYKLEDGWCGKDFRLEKVTISPLNKNFTYLDDKHQIIVGKSNLKQDIFDTIIFANRDIKYVKIPNHIKYIKSNSFENCKNLKAIEISEKSELVSIGKKSFSSAQISSLFIPANFEEFEDGWCRGVPKLKKVTISPSNKNFKYLDDEHQIIVGKSDRKQDIFDTIIFANRDIIQVKIPNHIKYIKREAFEHCKQLKTFEISENSELASISKYLFSYSSIQNLFIPASVEEIEDKWCREVPKLKKVTISPSNKNFKYLDDEHQIIVGKSDKKQDIFDTIIFANRDIKHAKIPNHIKYIKPYSFEQCKNLTKIEFQEESELISIGSNSFAYSSIKTITIPKSVTKIGKRTFLRCDDLQKFSLEEGSQLRSFETDLFFINKNLQFIEIPENSSIRIIHYDSFFDTKITELFLPASVEKIDNKWSFHNSKLKKVTISPSNKNFKYLDDEHQIIVGKSDTKQDIFDTIIFANRDIMQVKIPNHIKYIYSGAFENCELLRTIEISEDSELVTMSRYLCSTSIKSIFIPASVEEFEDGWCGDVPNLEKVTISPSNKNFKYLDDEHQIIVGKSDKKQDIFDTIIFANRDIMQVKIPNHIKYIKREAFEHCKQLKSIEFQEESELISIGYNSFSYSSVESIKIPKSVCEIQNGTFFCCDNLHTFSLEKGSKLKSIERYLFFSCKSLESIDIPDDSSITSIQNSAFNFSSIKSLFIPSTVEDLDDGWSGYASELKTITLSPSNANFKYLDNKHQIVVGRSNPSIEVFDEIVFGDRNIKRLQIPRCIKRIKSGAFQNCRQLKIIDIPDDSEIESIGNNAFANNTSLVNFKFPKKICFYGKDVLRADTKICYIEFLSDTLINDAANGKIFNGLINLTLVSFPNVNELCFSLDVNSITMKKRFTMFIKAGSEIYLE